jgi:hypothetical protein
MTKLLRNIPLYLVFSLTTSLAGKAQNWIWAKSFPGQNTDEVNAVCIDQGGNFFITGVYSSTLLAFGSNTLNNSGGEDIFLTKLNANGNVIWSKTAGGSGSDGGMGVCSDINNNLYLTGNYDSSTLTAGTNTLSNAGLSDAFLFKYDGNGNIIWAERFGGPGNDAISASVTDSNGNTFITGQFTSPVLVIGSTTLTNNGGDDMFCAKYDVNGNPVWAKSVGSTSFELGNSIALDVNGNIFISGYFEAPGLTIGTNTLVNAGGGNIFLAKYDNNGNVIWAKRFGGTAYDQPNSICTDGGENVYMTGSFNSPAITFGSFTLTTAGMRDVFLSKFDTNGNIIWANCSGGSGDDEGQSITYNNNIGRLFLRGNFLSSSIIFGATTLNFPIGMVEPMYLVTYDPNGNVICATMLDSGGDDYGQTIVSDQSGKLYVGGDFEIDQFVVGANTFPGPIGEDIFIAKYECTSTVGLIENKIDLSFQIYPNPTSGSLALSNEASVPGKVEIYNCLGSLIYSEEIKESKAEFDLGNQPNGIYLIRIGNTVKKIIKE